MKHSNTGYRNGCRCEVCRAAHAASHKRYRVTNADRVRNADRKRMPARLVAQSVRRRRQPEKFKALGRAAYSRNRMKRLAYAKAHWASLTPEERTAKTWRKYGLTPESWKALFESQEQRCAVCRTDVPGHRKGWVVDHCHLTGKVRGILCSRCNTMLGILGDRALDVRITSERCIDYLNRTDSTVEELREKLGRLLEADKTVAS